MKKISLILALLTALVLVGALVGCSEYEAPPPPFKPTLSTANVTPVGGTVTASGSGYVLTQTDNGFGAGYVFLKIDFKSNRLSDYSTVTFKVSADGDNGYKRVGVAAYTSIPGTVASADSLISDGSVWGPQVNLANKDTVVDIKGDIDPVKAAAFNANNELYIMIMVQMQQTKVTVTDISFNF